jgi:hypothetical protein
VDVADGGVVDPGGHEDGGQIVGDGQLGTGGNEGTFDAIVECDGAVGGRSDDLLRLPEAVPDVEAPMVLSLRRVPPAGATIGIWTKPCACCPD